MHFVLEHFRGVLGGGEATIPLPSGGGRGRRRRRERLVFPAPAGPTPTTMRVRLVTSSRASRTWAASLVGCAAGDQGFGGDRGGLFRAGAGGVEEAGFTASRTRVGGVEGAPFGR